MDLQELQGEKPCWREDVQEMQMQIPEAQKKGHKGEEGKRMILIMVN
jgi:hypothetical protein